MTNANYNPLTPEEAWVIESKGTEMPFTGEYDNFYETGSYVCRRCDVELYRSNSTLTAGGLLSTKRSMELFGSFATLTACVSRLNALTAEVTLATCLWEKGLLQLMPVIA